MSLPLPIQDLGEELCLSYANTLAWRGAAEPAEALGDLASLLTWLSVSAHCPLTLIAEAEAWSRQHPKRGARLFAEAIDLRETIYRSGVAIADGGAVPAADLAALNSALVVAPARARLIEQSGSYAWAIEHSQPSAPLLLAPILWSAADLLSRAARLRLRCCGNAQCRWLFIDQSKGGTRRWCDMASCGNRAKAQRHYRKSRSG